MLKGILTTLLHIFLYFILFYFYLFNFFYFYFEPYFHYLLLKLYFTKITHSTMREKSPYSEFSWSVFSSIRTEYGEIPRISSYSVQMQENMDQKNSKYQHFSRSARLWIWGPAVGSYYISSNNCLCRFFLKVKTDHTWRRNIIITVRGFEFFKFSRKSEEGGQNFPIKKEDLVK